MQEVTYPPNGSTRTIRSSRVGDLITDSPRLLITGDYQAGKTSFAKMTFGCLHAAGYVPVLVDAAGKPPTDERLHRRLVDLYGEQYSTPGKDAYRQLNRSRRAVVVDNYHRLPSNPRARNSFIKALADFADRIILVAHDLAAETAALLQPRGRVENTAPFAAYHIMPFGPARRTELVDRWLLLDEDADASTVEFAHQRERIITVLSGLIGRRWLPAYPVYMLSVLQSHEAVNPMDSQISTYGAYYEILIRAALARGQAPIQAEVVRSYLAHFAHQLFQNRLTEVDDSTFTRIHREYERRYEITRSADALRSYLTTCQVFAISGDTLRFRYKYIYYYLASE